MSLIREDNIPVFSLTTPYEVIYRKDSSRTPVGPHTHNGAELYLTLTSLPDVLLNDKVSEIAAGSLIIIPPFCIHQLFHDTHVVFERYILSLNIDWLEQVFYTNKNIFSYLKYNSNPFVYTLPEDILKQYIHLLQPLLKPIDTISISLLTDFFQLLDFIDQQLKHANLKEMQQSLYTNNAQQRINEIIGYLNEHLYENVSLNDLGKQFYLNPDYLSRLFKKHMHITIGHYIALQRINHAQSLLRQGKSISKVQELLGYSSYAHFAKTFKKVTGMTPGQYRCSCMK